MANAIPFDPVYILYCLFICQEAFNCLQVVEKTIRNNYTPGGAAMKLIPPHVIDLHATGFIGMYTDMRACMYMLVCILVCILICADQYVGMFADICMLIPGNTIYTYTHACIYADIPVC